MNVPVVAAVSAVPVPLRMPFARALRRARQLGGDAMVPRAPDVEGRPWPDVATPALATRPDELGREACAPSTLLSRVAEVASAGRGAPGIRLDVSPDVAVRIDAGAAGLALTLEVPARDMAPAEAALPRLVATLRARGIAVRAANVRTGPAGRRAR